MNTGAFVITPLHGVNMISGIVLPEPTSIGACRSSRKTKVPARTREVNVYTLAVTSSDDNRRVPVRRIRRIFDLVTWIGAILLGLLLVLHALRR